MEWSNVREDGNPGYYWQMLEAMAHHYHIDLNRTTQGNDGRTARSHPAWDEG